MRSLTVKLILAFLIVSLVGAAIAAVMSRAFTLREFNTLVLDRARENYVEQVTLYYETYHTWNGVALLFEVFGNPGMMMSSRPGEQMIMPPAFALVDMNGFVVAPAGEYISGQAVASSSLKNATRVTVNGEVVGYVVETNISPRMDSREASYLARTNRILLLSGLGAALISIVLGIILARSLSSPLRALTGAARKIAKGGHIESLPVKSKDEIGELTHAFNQMNDEIAEAAELRKQMTADIAHDLRTPLTVMSGYLEGMREGVLKPTSERFDTMYSEVRHLSRLVEDLRTLSLADAGELSINKRLTDPADLVRDTATTFKVLAQKKKIALKVETDKHLPEVNVDPERIGQVLDNLVSNALRYTEAKGKITLSACSSADGVALTVADTGVGIPLDVLPHVFERFYRGDSSRQGDESGLGLAISRSIIELHGGRISAHSEGIGKGSSFTVFLPKA